MGENKNFLNLKSIYLLLPSRNKKTQFWILLLFILFGAIVETFSVSAILPILGAIVDSNLTENFPFLGFFLDNFGSVNQNELIKITLLFFVLIYCFKFCYMILLNYFKGRFIFEVQSEISQKLFENYLYRSYIFHLNSNSATLVRNSTIEINQYGGTLDSFLGLIVESTMVLGIILVLIYAQPYSAIATITILALFNLSFYAITNKHISAWGRLRQELDGRILKNLQQGLNGIKEVIVFNLHDFFCSNYRLPVIQRSKVSVKQYMLTDLPRLMLELLLVMGMTGLIFNVVMQDQDPKNIIPIIGMFGVAAFRVMPSSGKILAAIQKIQFNSPSVDTLLAELDIKKSKLITNLPKNIIYKEKQKSLSISSLTFGYSNITDNLLIKNLSLDFEINKTFGIVGKSGSGKSTLINIILGLINPISGKIVFPKFLENKSNKFGYVPQNIFLVDDTIKKNIALGIPDENIDNERLKSAIKGAQLEDYIDSLPEKIETIVGENGTRLSGGQKQRIGIARALYRDPYILIFDESTSSLDKETESKIVQTIKQLNGTRTILIVSHNKEPLKYCDSIFDLNTGIMNNK